MGVVHVRIDDRLIHGQVVEGWLRVVQADHIVVASDAAAQDPLQVGLMRLAVPPETRVDVLKVDDAAVALKGGSWGGDRVMLLIPGVREARRLAEAGVAFESINLGGLHDAPGRVALTPSLALAPEERRDLEALLARKIAVETRVLPNDEKTDVRVLLERSSPGRVADVRPQ